MRVKIQDPAVRQNVQFLVDVLPKTEGAVWETEQRAHAVVKASFDRETGQFLPEKGGEVLLSGGSYKPISISYHYDVKIGAVSVDVAEESEAFQVGDMAPEARKVLLETLKVMNTLCQKLKGPSDIATKMQVLRDLVVSSDFPEKDRPLILCTWHPVDRMQAEELLSDKPVGTFFFRKDDFTRVLETQLQQGRKAKVQCFTLTYKADAEKISDLVLIHSKGRWQIYDDDPSLKGPGFRDLKEIIDRHSFQWKFPLYRRSG